MTTLLQPWADDVWIAAAPQTMLGLHLGTRMTVVRLPGGALWVHSPIAATATLRAELDALGPVAHIVAPSLFHHLHAGDIAKAYPRAMVHAPGALRRKRPDLEIDADLSGAAHPDWRGVLSPLPIEGCSLRETVFHHARSRSVISSDLTENFSTSPHWPTRLYLKAGGVHGKVGWSRLLRFVYRDKKAARRSIDALLERDFDRAVIAHGDPLTSGAKDAVRETFAFL